MKALFATLVISLSVFIPFQLSARLMSAGPSFEEMQRKSDLIVIATSIGETIDCKIKEIIDPPDVLTQTDKSQFPAKVLGVETKFSVLTVLKGPPATKAFALHHCREKEGRYSPISSQTDPVVTWFGLFLISS